MKRWINILKVCFFAFIFMVGVTKPSSAGSEFPKSIALGTSSIGSTFYTISAGMANIISKHAGVNVTVESVGGSDANIRAIKMGKIQMAMVNTFSSGNAFRGIGQFSAEGKFPVRLIAIGQPSLRQLVARTDSRIQTPYDLKGKRLVAKRRALKEIEMVADAIISVYGIKKKDVKYISTASTREAIEALITGTVDAAIIPGGVPASTLMKLFERINAKFVDISQDKMYSILKILGPDFHMEVVPAGTYRGQKKDAIEPALSASLVVEENLSDNFVYKITKALFENYNDLKLVHKAARYWTVKNSLEKFNIPFHPGAIRYFKEIGAWSSVYEKKQQSLLSKR